MSGNGGVLALPFAHLNLRWNPFGEPTVAEWAALAVAETPRLQARDPVQFVGPCGHGKTTHLLALLARHPAAVYERLDEGRDRCLLPAGGTFLLDEAQRLRPRWLRRLVATDACVALGSHQDLSALAGQRLRTVRLAVVDASRLRLIVERRIEWARRGPGVVPCVSDSVLQALVSRYGGDVRATLGSLYDALQRLKEPGHVEV